MPYADAGMMKIIFSGEVPGRTEEILAAQTAISE
jgi:hypothetical protein